MVDQTTLRAHDVERPLRDLLEDWEDAVKNALDTATEKEAKAASVPGGASMFRALGLLNGAKDFGGNVLQAASLTVAPQWGIPWKILNSTSGLLSKASDQAARLKVFQGEYDKLRDDIMDKIHDQEIAYPNSAHGRELMERVEQAASGLTFRDAVAKHTWAGMFLKELGVIELNQSAIDAQMEHRYRPIFDALRLILRGSLYNDRSAFGRMISLDPNWKWDRGDVHVPGTHHRDHGMEPFDAPRKGFTHATPDQVKKIIVNLKNYRIESRTILVGASSYATTSALVEAVEVFRPPTISLDAGTMLDPIFRPEKVRAAHERATRETGAQVSAVH